MPSAFSASNTLWWTAPKKYLSVRCARGEVRPADPEIRDRPAHGVARRVAIEEAFRVVEQTPVQPVVGLAEQLLEVELGRQR